MKNTYIFHYSHQLGNLYNITIELDNELDWEKIYHNLRYEVLKKNLLYDGKITNRVTNIVKICDMFGEAGFRFESVIQVEGTDYKIFQRK